MDIHVHKKGLYVYMNVFLAALSPSYTDGSTLPSYPLQSYCDNTIGQSNYAAELTFDADPLHSSAFSRHDGNCDVIVEPQHLGRVLFYFTEFNVGTRCKDNNVTVYDGDMAAIEGLSDALCGHNTSLLEQQSVFTSWESSFRIRYQWNEDGERISARFKLKIVSFTTRSCESHDKLFDCPNGRCVAKEVTCMEGLNTCGSTELESCNLEQKIENWITEAVGSVRNVIVIILIIIGLFAAKRFLYNKWKREYGSIRNFPFIRRIFGSQQYPTTDVTRRYSVESSSQSSSDSHERVSLTAGSQNEETNNTDNIPLENTSEHTEPDTGWQGTDARYTIQNNDVLPPPPSYESIDDYTSGPSGNADYQPEPSGTLYTYFTPSSGDSSGGVGGESGGGSKYVDGYGSKTD